MYQLQPHEIIKKPFLGLWSLMAFQAGFINSIGFLSCQRFVSHVTGFGTQVGITLGKGQYLATLETLTIPIAFICGAWFSGHLTVAREVRKLIPRYNWVTLVIPILLCLLLYAGNRGIFGSYNSPQFDEDFPFLATLSFICGAQNACFATLTKGLIRTTHLTGISTDLGTDLALLLSGNLSDSERMLTRGKNIMRVMTIVSFFFGAMISAIADTRLEYWSLTIPLSTSLFVGILFQLVEYKNAPETQNKQPEIILSTNQPSKSFEQ